MFNIKLIGILDKKILTLNSNTRNHLAGWKQISSNLFKNTRPCVGIDKKTSYMHHIDANERYGEKARYELYLSYVPPTYEYGTRPFLRWVLSQGRSPTREAVPKMPRTPSAFPFSGRLRRRAINPTPPKRVEAWGDGPLRPEVMYPVVEHTRTDCAARNHSRSRVPHHRTQSSIV